MKVIKPSYEILSDKTGGIKILKDIEIAARTCYKSEDKITDKSSEDIVSHLIKRGHEAMLEFGQITVKFICDRGVSHELVRHRLASYAQESTRYCNYTKGKFNGHVTFIRPVWLEEPNTYDYDYWAEAMRFAERRYIHLINDWGWSAQKARSVLPNSLKTEVVMSANIREWRHFFVLRTSKAAHPQMRELSIPLLDDFKKYFPVLFNDIKV